MKLSHLSTVMTMLTALIIAAVAMAAVPQSINYQGYLKNTAGTPVNTATNIRFSLYSSNPARNNPVWMESKSVTPSNGIYSTQLGSVTPIAAPFDVPYWLGVKVAGDAEMALQPLASAPYAMKAATVTDSSITSNSISGTIAANKLDLSSVVKKSGDTMTGTLNLPANGLTVGSNQFVVSGSKVGIGIQTPIDTLDVVGNVRINDKDLYLRGFFGDTNHGLGWYGTGKTFATVALDGPVLYGYSGGALGSYDGTIQKVVLRWDNSGKIGVGTATPNEQLEITGNLRLPATTATTGIIKSGANPLIHTYGGSTNFYAGVLAGNLTTTGTYNTASGAVSLTNLTSGQLNTASGWGSLHDNTIGSENAAFGVSALYSNTTAGQNTAVGNYALYFQSFNNSNTKWLSNNTAVGFEALRNNQPGATTNGIENTALGSQSLRANTLGKENTASGYMSLNANTIGSYNTASGGWSLVSNTSGDSNVAIGDGALAANMTSSYNTAVGTGALTASVSGAVGSQNTAIGYRAGSGSVVPTSIGDQNTFLGTYAHAFQNSDNAIAIGYGATVNASNYVRIGNSSIIQIGGQVAWSNLSDMRDKDDVADIPYGLDFIHSLRPVEFRLKGGNQHIDFGFLAQDIETILGTEYNILGIDPTEERKLSLRYTDFIAPMVKAIQEQQTLIEAQGSMIKELKDELETMKAMMSR